MDDQQKVYYVIDRKSGNRVSKFYSKLGFAKNSPLAKKYPESYEVVTMYCVDYESSLWSRIGKGFAGLFPRESSVVIESPGQYRCSLVLQDRDMNLVELESK